MVPHQSKTGSKETARTHTPPYHNIKSNIDFRRRFTSNQKLFRKLIDSCAENDIIDSRWALGGNAPIMGMRFNREGANVLLASQMTNK